MSPSPLYFVLNFELLKFQVIEVVLICLLYPTSSYDNGAEFEQYLTMVGQDRCIVQSMSVCSCVCLSLCISPELIGSRQS